jgi:magnesium transporter
MRLFFSLLSNQLFTINCKRTLFETIKKTRNYQIGLNYCLSNCRFQSTESIKQSDLIPASSHKLNCDIFLLTKDGGLQVHQGPFDRAQICQEYGLEPRDLQKIDTDLLINVPIIDVRQNRFICFSFRRLRSLVQFDRSIFFVPSADKVIGEPFGIRDAVHWERIAQDYHRNIRYIHQIYSERFINQRLNNFDAIPFEFRITEINLEAVANGLKLKTNDLLNQFKNVRERAYARITVGSLRELVLLKEKVDKYKRNADLAHQSIVDVLAQDEDMIGMYLTDNRKREISDHIQAELLLEACTKQMAEVRRSISDLSDSVRTLESATGFMLDAVRNELLAFEIKINIITMGFGMGAFIAGIYGMNLSNSLEQNPYAFYVVTGTSFCFITGIIAVAIIRLFRYRKIRLHRSNKIDIV